MTMYTITLSEDVTYDPTKWGRAEWGWSKMSHAVPYTARCLSLFNPLWEGEGGGEGNWYLRASLPDLGLGSKVLCVFYVSFPAFAHGESLGTRLRSMYSAISVL